MLADDRQNGAIENHDHLHTGVLLRKGQMRLQKKGNKLNTADE